MVFDIPNPHGLDELDFPLYPVDALCARVVRKSVYALIQPYSHVPPASTFRTPSNGVGLFGAVRSAKSTAPPQLTVETVGVWRLCCAVAF